MSRGSTVVAAEEIGSNVAHACSSCSLLGGDNDLAAAVVRTGGSEPIDALLARLEEAEIVKRDNDELFCLCLACEYRSNGDILGGNCHDISVSIETDSSDTRVDLLCICDDYTETGIRIGNIIRFFGFDLCRKVFCGIVESANFHIANTTFPFQYFYAAEVMRLYSVFAEKRHLPLRDGVIQSYLSFW